MEPLRRSTASAEQTFALGLELGRVLQPGDFVGLSGSLGAGKTLFSRGVASGAGVAVDDVSSPTYSIVQSYRGRLQLHHADLYRLRTEADLYATGYFDLLETDAAFLVEWVDQVTGAAPDDALLVLLEVAAPDARSITVRPTGPAALALAGRWLGAL